MYKPVNIDCVKSIDFPPCFQCTKHSSREKYLGAMPLKPRRRLASAAGAE